jgi:hypothetical protein
MGVLVGSGGRVDVAVGVHVGVHVGGKGCTGVEVGTGVDVAIGPAATIVGVGNGTDSGLNGLNMICGFTKIAT